MKKVNKKLLTLLMAATFVSAGAGAIVAYNNAGESAAIAASAETTESTETKVDYSNTCTAASNFGKTGDFKEAAQFRIWMKRGDSSQTWGKNICLNAGDYEYLLEYLTFNGKSIAAHRAEYKALIQSGATSPITYTGMDIDQGAEDTHTSWGNVSGTNYMQPNIAEDVMKDKRAIFAPIFVNVTNHGADGDAIDIYVPVSYMAPESITEFGIKEGFGIGNFTFSKGIAFVREESGSYTKINALEAKAITIAEAVVDGKAGELYRIDISCDKWSFTQAPDDYNYFGERFQFMRKNILLNGVSLWDINTTVDDSDYVYSTSPMTSGDTDSGTGYQLFQNPTRLYGVQNGNTLSVYVHKKYFEDLNANEVTLKINKGYVHNNDGQVLDEEVSATVWKKPINVTIDGKAQEGFVYGDKVAKPETPADYEEGGYKYTFDNWYLAGTDTVYDFEAALEADVAIESKFNKQAIEYTVTFVADSETVATETYTVEDQEITVPEVPAKEGYTGKWEAYELTTGNITVNAEYEAIEYTYTLVIDRADRMNGTKFVTLKYGEALTVEAPTAEGKEFLGWVDVEGNAVTLPETMPASDATLFASWKVTAYKLTIVNGDSEKVITFGVEANGVDASIDSLAFVLAGELPKETVEYSYAWEETIPETFELKDYTFTVVATAKVVEATISEALEATDGTAVIVSGTVCTVNTAWSDSYNNISVTITDSDGNELYVYRLATKVALGDVITITGSMDTYNDKRQIAQGATAEITGHDSSYDYKEMSIEEAIKAADNTNVIVTGTVVEIKTAYSSQHNNISVDIADENGTRLYVYRLTGNVEVGQIIKIKGAMATYQEARQITGGTFEVVGTHECSKFTDATCENPAACVVCGTEKDDVLAEHNYVDGTCSVCGKAEEVVPPTSEEPEVPPTSQDPVDPEEPEEDKEKKGCFGTVTGIGMASALTAVGAALIIKKRKED